MAVRTPEDLIRNFTEAFNAGDADTLMALYEPGASLVAGPGQVATGTEALRQAIQGFLALKPTLTMELSTPVVVGELALTGSRWTLNGTDPSGAPITMAGVSAEIVRRQSDGTWLLVVDNPFAGS
ncbi:MAG TPA: SgcJ/EcaC family oxidoreductase [Chloroflexota bacterium]|nr:SgcJ/EcaC family oxidoreductase [Chloroflexota bacterium]